MTAENGQKDPRKVASGRMGGRTKAIRYAGRGSAATEAARSAYYDKFLRGEHECVLCGRVEMPHDLPLRERAHAADIAMQNHLARMRAARWGR